MDDKYQVLYYNDGKGKYQSHEVIMEYVSVNNENVFIENESLTVDCYGETLEDALMELYNELLTVKAKVDGAVAALESGNCEVVSKWTRKQMYISENTNYWTGDVTEVQISDIIQKVKDNISVMKEKKSSLYETNTKNCI